MTGAKTVYLVHSVRDGLQAFESLRSHFSSQAAGRSERRRTYFDTFDWRLHRKGGLFLTDQSKSELVLCWRALTGEILFRRRIETRPEFAWEIGEVAFRKALEMVVGIRRLLPLADLKHERKTLRILDSNEKTIAQVHLEQSVVRKPGDPGGWIRLPVQLRITKVKGYDRDYDRMTRFVVDDLGLTKGVTDELALTLSELGIEAESYSSRLQLQLTPEMRADEAAKRVLRALLDVLIANEEGTKTDLDAEFLHDFRVAVRRTRTCLAQIPEVFPSETVKRYRDEFSWLGTITGATRDLDVYLLNMVDYSASLPHDVRGDLEPLRKYLSSRKRFEQKRLQRCLGSTRYRNLIRNWREFLAQPVPQTNAPPNARQPIIEVASDRLALCYRRVLKQGGKIRHDSPPALVHRLRISCKKLRYLLTFFSCLFERTVLDEVIKELKAFQDNLGNLNDLQIQQQMLTDFAGQMHQDEAATTRSLMAMGRLVEQLASRQVSERASFDKGFRRFSKQENQERFFRILDHGKKSGT